MTKKKDQLKTNDDNLFAGLAKSSGGNLLDDMDKTKGLIDLGVLSLNFLVSGKFVGGGLPVGICAEAYGGSSSGKTLIGTNLLRGCQTANGIAIFLDAERTISKEFAVKASHVDPKKLIVLEGDTLEACFNKVFKIVRQAREDVAIPIERPIVVVYDSIAASPSEREFAETTLDMEEASQAAIKAAGAGSDKPGERAKICSKELRKLTPFLEQNNATVLFINQQRQKIGVMFGDDKTGAGGGMALPYYCSTRINLSAFKTIKDDTGKVIGTNVSVRNTKNKISRPFVNVSGLRLFYDRGIDPFGGLLDLLIQERRITATDKAGVYLVNPKFSGGREVKFKSSKDRNDVPSDVLLDCPALVDATDPLQVQYYVDMFGGATLDVNADIVEEDVNLDE